MGMVDPSTLLTLGKPLCFMVGISIGNGLFTNLTSLICQIWINMVDISTPLDPNTSQKGLNSPNHTPSTSSEGTVFIGL